jgi:hypothetical protein
MEEMLASAGVEDSNGGALSESEAEEAQESELEPSLAAQQEDVPPPVARPFLASVSPARPRAAGEGALSMTLTGSMRLSLKYEQDGQEVCVSFTDQFLMVSLADGTEFKIPVARAASRAAA